MRCVLLMLVLLFLASLAPSVFAVPVDPNPPNQIAAWTSGNYVLRTNGEVWFWTPGSGWSLGNVAVFPPPPVAVSLLADWETDRCILLDGTVYFRVGVDWLMVPPPPFATVAAQKKSLGSAKQGYR
jgi:hypothetical protein